MLHTLVAALPDSLDISRTDTLLPDAANQELAKRLAAALQATEVIEHFSIEDKEAGADQAVGLRFFHEALDFALSVSFEHSEA